MNSHDPSNRLSQIRTRWSLIFQAHRDQADEAARAQQELVERYGGAIYLYLLGMVRDPHLAEDLAQDFAVRLVRGDFNRADPRRGRFRDFLKAALRNLVVDHWRRHVPETMPETHPEPADPSDPGSDEAFLARWREELLDRAWEDLAVVEKETGQPYYHLLRLKADHPELRSAEIASRMSSRMGRPVTEAAVRKTMQRARERFADLLLDEVARSIRSRTREDVEDELRELDLLAYCQSALDRYADRES